jgi:hypothetical protein
LGTKLLAKLSLTPNAFPNPAWEQEKKSIAFSLLEFSPALDNYGEYGTAARDHL